jgi:hypothetical protein
MGPGGGRLRGGAGGSAGHCTLRNGITRETYREDGRNDKAFDHRNLSLLSAPKLVFQKPV